MVITNTSSNNTRDGSTHGRHQMIQTQIRLIGFFATKGREVLYSPKKKKKKRPGVDYGSDQKLLFAKFRLKLKEVRKTTRPFTCDLNQISYDYKVDVTNEIKELDLVERILEKLWMELCNSI